MDSAVLSLILSIVIEHYVVCVCKIISVSKGPFLMSCFASVKWSWIRKETFREDKILIFVGMYLVLTY